MNNRISDKKLSHLFGIGVVLAFILPHTNIGFLLINPLLCLLYKYVSGYGVKYSKAALVVVPLLLTLLINFAQDVSLKSVVMAITMIMYFYTYPMIRNVRLPQQYLFFCLFFILMSQLAYIFQIPYMANILDTMYPISQDDVYGTAYIQDNASLETIFDYRMGGLYRNANLCAMSLSILLAIYIVLNAEKPIKKNLLFVSLCCFGIIITGSRTGFAVASAILILYAYQDKRVSEFWRVAASLIMVIAIIYIMSTGSSEYRALNVGSGLNDSASIKFRTFLYYITNEDSVLKLFFGYIDATRFNSSSTLMQYFDSDYGNIIFCYGIIGFLAIIYFFATLFFKMDKIGKLYFVVLLWMVSAAIISSYRHLFIFMMLLPIVSQLHSGNRKNVIPFHPTTNRH